MKKSFAILSFLLSIFLTAFVSNAISSVTSIQVWQAFLPLFAMSLIFTMPKEVLAVTINTMPSTLSPIAKQLASIPSTLNNAMNKTPQAERNTPLSGIIIPQGDHTFSNIGSMLSANQYSIPDSISVVITSTSAVGSAPTRIFLFNQAFLQNITNNGGGAGTIAYTWEDGSATGGAVSEIVGGARSNVGAICYGVSLRYDVTPPLGVITGNPAGVAGSAPAFLINTGYAFPMPTNLNPTSNQTRKDQDQSIGVYPVIVNVPRFAQFSAVIPASGLLANVGQVDTLTATFYFTKDYTI